MSEEEKGITGAFKSPIQGDDDFTYQLKIYIQYVTSEILQGLSRHDYNESYQLWRSDKPNNLGYTGVIVKMRKHESKD